ncbi:MAG: RsmE family RNA methyltransferase [Acidimicrobiales bacterium]
MEISERLRRHPLVFVDNLADPIITPSDAAHLARSLRMVPGDQLNLSDGAGQWVRAVLTSKQGSVEVEGEVEVVPAPIATLGIAFTPTKGVKPEAVVKKLTELGINRFAVMQSKRSIVSYDEIRAERLMRRLHVTVREACQQSRQPQLPTLEGVVALEDLISSRAHVLLAEPSGPSLWDRVFPVPKALWVAIGPEGGWTERERSLGDPIGLPGGILRAETAAIAAGVVLAALRERVEGEENPG